ncbi:amino acid permease [Escherichia coli]|nr:amino acid permease [Escherichia coli]
MATSVQTGKAKQLTLLGFFAITASMVMAVYEYPTFATSGFSLVFFLLLGGILWFIPVGLCAAEMATVDGWEEGGVFAWVSNTLGPRWGFAAISFGYLQIAIGFIPMLYFVLGALSYILRLRLRGWQVPAFTLGGEATDIVVMRIMCRRGFEMDFAELLLEDYKASLKYLSDHPKLQGIAQQNSFKHT